MALITTVNNLRLTWNRTLQRWVSESGMQFTDAEIAVWRR